MATITIRKLDDATVERLKVRARSNGRSMEEEVRMILSREAGSQRLRGPEAADHFRRLQKELFGDRVFTDGAELLREVRDEDPVPRTGK